MAGKYIKTDRFGNLYQVVGCKDARNPDFNVGFIELGNKLYKVEVSAAQKDGVQYWVKVTAQSAKKKHTSM